MSGHSKWHSIKHQKAITDSRRSAAFTKLANIITIAAREGGGGDPDSNFKLRLAMQKAREANMPNDNVERAIKRGTGEDAGTQIQEITYEGYGPDGVALLIETVTDNKNRTSNEIRSKLSKMGGSFGSAGSVAWQFSLKGIIRISNEKLQGQNAEELQLKLIDHGAEDVREEPEGWTIITSKEGLAPLAEFIHSENIATDSQGLEHIPKNPVKAEHADALKALVQELEDMDDVQNVYTNAEGI